MRWVGLAIVGVLMGLGALHILPGLVGQSTASSESHPDAQPPSLSKARRIYAGGTVEGIHGIFAGMAGIVASGTAVARGVRADGGRHRECMRPAKSARHEDARRASLEARAPLGCLKDVWTQAA